MALAGCERYMAPACRLRREILKVQFALGYRLEFGTAGSSTALGGAAPNSWAQ